MQFKGADDSKLEEHIPAADVGKFREEVEMVKAVYPPFDRQAYLEAARDQLTARATKSAAEWELEARLVARLGRLDRAAAAYRRALGLAPRQVAWRVAYAEVLRRSGFPKDARQELETLVAQDPNNRPARDQLEVVRRELKLRGEE